MTAAAGAVCFAIGFVASLLWGLRATHRTAAAYGARAAVQAGGAYGLALFVYGDATWWLGFGLMAQMLWAPLAMTAALVLMWLPLLPMLAAVRPEIAGWLPVNLPPRRGCDRTVPPVVTAEESHHEG